MSINEWTNRLGICTTEQIVSGEVGRWERGAPGSKKSFDKNTTWARLTGRNKEYNYANAQAYHLRDPILRISHILILSNVMGMSTTFSKMPLTSLYFLDRLERGIKVNLGYWLANVLLLICKTPNRNLTLCHIVGVFVRRNFNLNRTMLSFDNPAPRPYTLDITCLLRAGVIREEGGRYHFYKPGDAPKDMKKVGGTEAKSIRKIEEKLAKLDELEMKLYDIEDAIYKTRRNQLQVLDIINKSQLYQGDALTALRNVCVEFMAKIGSLAKENFAGELESDEMFAALLKRAFDEETERVRKERCAGGTSQEGKGSEQKEQGTTRGQSPVDTNMGEVNPTEEDNSADEAGDQEGEEAPPPPKQTEKAPRKPRGW